MQINDKRVKDNTTFEIVELGEVFSWAGEFWMRTKPCKSNDMSRNAVNIVDGRFAFFDDSDSIETLNTELTVR